MHTLKVTLKQYTPLIHFQHDQEGATLRASEVKPKLDKFILETNNYDDLDADIKTCLIGYSDELDRNGKLRESFHNGKCSLDYKLKIKSIGDRTTSNEQDLPSYFGEGAKGVSYHSVEITFLSKQSMLIDEIKSYISDFFIINNFGNRNNKGYGSFFVDTIDSEPNNLSFEDVEKVLKYYFQLVYQRNERPNDNLLKTINDDYQLLKSGKNYPYKKSIVFGYALSKGIRWEKRKIKREIYNAHNANLNLMYNHPPRYGNHDEDLSWFEPGDDEWEGDELNAFRYCFIRALLGLPNHYEFKLENDGICIVDIKRVRPYHDDDRPQDVITIGDRRFTYCDDIERFQSPLMFKIITLNNQSKLYLLSKENQFDTKMMRKTFIFQIKKIKRGQELIDLGNPICFKIMTPNSNNFSLEELLQYATDDSRRDNIPFLNYIRLCNTPQ